MRFSNLDLSFLGNEGSKDIALLTLEEFWAFYVKLRIEVSQLGLVADETIPRLEDGAVPPEEWPSPLFPFF